MKVTERPRRRTRVVLPGDVQRPFDVYVNGIQQQEGVDFVVRNGTLLFDRELVREKVGARRWTSMVLGIAGSYGKNDSVDVLYRVRGESRVAAGLPLEPAD
jgi:hypothetical protein